MTFPIILIFAELERNMTSERVTGIMLDRAESGLWNGGLPPLGYKKDPEKKIPLEGQTIFINLVSGRNADI